LARAVPSRCEPSRPPDVVANRLMDAVKGGFAGIADCHCRTAAQSHIDLTVSVSVRVCRHFRPFADLVPPSALAERAADRCTGISDMIGAAAPLDRNESTWPSGELVGPRLTACRYRIGFAARNPGRCRQRMSHSAMAPPRSAGGTACGGSIAEADAPEDVALIESDAAGARALPQWSQWFVAVE